MLHHILLDWNWWSYAGSNALLLKQSNHILTIIKRTWHLTRPVFSLKVLAKGGSRRLKGRFWSAVLCYPHGLTYFCHPWFSFYAEVRFIYTIWQDEDDTWTVTSRICHCSKQFKKMHKDYTQNSGASFPLHNYFTLSAKYLNLPEDASSSINIADTAENSWDFL